MIGLPWDTSIAVTSELTAALWFAAAVLLLDRFDIALPRGDSMGVSGALVAGGLLVTAPLYVIPLTLAALILAHIGRWSSARWRLSAAFFTRLTAATFAASVLWLVGRFDAGAQLEVARLLAGSVGYLVVEVAVAQMLLSSRSSRSLPRLLAGNFRRQAPLVAAQASAAMLAAITYPRMGAWSLVLVVVLLLLIRQSVASLLEIRETYRATIEVLVEAAEGQDTRLAGHAERTAHIARSIGDRIGLSAAELERISYASLLHDLGALSSDAGGAASAVLEETVFFRDVVPVLRVCDGVVDPAAAPEADLRDALLVGLASEIDAIGSLGLTPAHHVNRMQSLSPYVPAHLKARVVAAAIELGYRIPAVV